MERIFNVLHKEWGSLHEAAFLLATTALMSQVLGLLRDRLLVGKFGAGDELDVYYASFRIPDLLYVSIASFVAVTVLIPFFLEHIGENKSVAAARAFMTSVNTWFVLAMAVASTLAFLLMPYLAHFVVPGFTPAKTEEFILLSRILLLSPFLLGLSNLFGTITQSLRRFFVFAFGPILYNAGILFGIFVLLPRFGLTGVVIGVLIGAALHLAIQLPVLVRESLVPLLTFHPKVGDLKKVVTLSIPRTLALSAANISGMILIALASGISGGAIAVFTLAMNLQNIPLSLIGMSYSVAAFPTLARLWSTGGQKEFLDNIVTASRHIIFWSFPIIVLFIVLRAQIVRTILGTGAFDWSATQLTAAALALFSLSVIAQNLVLLFTRASYAMGKTFIPLVANVTSACVSVIAALILSYFFKNHETFRYFCEILLRVPDIPSAAVLMLPLGYTIGALVNLCMFFLLFRGLFSSIFHSLKRAFLHSFTASILIGFVAYLCLQEFAKIFEGTIFLKTFIGIFSQGLFSGVIGIIFGVFILHILESRELAEVRVSLHKKFWKSDVIAAEKDEV